MEDEEMSELKIIGTRSLSCDVEGCGATGVNLAKASLPALQYYFSHVVNYENMSVNICCECVKKVDFFNKTKDSVLNGDWLLSIDIPVFQKPPTKVIDVDSDDDTIPPPKKRKDIDDIDELDEVVHKVLKKLNIPEQLSKRAALVKRDMDRLEEDMKSFSNDIHSVYNVYNSHVRQLLRPVETVTTRETTINSDGTITKTRLAPYPTVRMKPTDNEVLFIEEVINLDKEDDEVDEIELINVEAPLNDGRTLDKLTAWCRPLPEVDNVVISRYQDGGARQHCWVHGKVVEVLSELDELVVEFSGRETVRVKVPLTAVAYCIRPNFVLPRKMRVVVAVDERSCLHGSSVPHYQPGIIVENKLMVTCDDHYLVSLDNGQCRYVAHRNVRIMCGGGLDEFLKERVCTYPETDEYFKCVVSRLANRGDLMRVPRNGVVVVLRNGEWHVAHIEPVKVENGKSDVVKVQFEREVEWLFRGSPRFYQVLRHFRPGTEVEYPGWYGEVETRNRGMLLDEEYQENCLASCVGFEGVINTLKLPVEPLSVEYDRHGDQWKSMSPLAIPLHFGWKRTLSRKNVEYVSPCGKKFNNFKTLFEYLRVTKSQWNIGSFCFDVNVDVCKTFVARDVRSRVEDISDGSENIPIPCVNSVDDKPMPVFQYKPECEVGPDVMEGHEQEFTQCCDCTDNCTNNTCACRRMTVERCAEDVNGKPVESYVRNRKLVNSEVFECGERCPCQKNLCTNRLVQNGMQWPLLVFKTKNKGWAVRATCDIPKGAFICVFAGALNTKDKGEEIADDIGGEYALDLVFQERFGKYKDKREVSEETIIRDNSLESKSCFIINPKQVGNVGRFFSHSCNPNMFTQHVFVDSQDPRFPQPSFFTSSVVKAGSELTWNYNYQSDGVVEIQCYCRAFNCKKRLM